MPGASSSMTAASMSMTSPATELQRSQPAQGRRAAHSADGLRSDPAIVPRDTIAGNALAAVVAIMTFLAAMTIGGIAMIVGTSSQWRADIVREMTIQVRPTGDRDIGVEWPGSGDRPRIAGYFGSPHLFEGGIRAAARTVAWPGFFPRRITSAADDRGQGRFRRDPG